MNFVPYVIEKTAQGERSYDIYSRLLKERIVFLNGEVNDAVSNSIGTVFIGTIKVSIGKRITSPRPRPSRFLNFR